MMRLLKRSILPLSALLLAIATDVSPAVAQNRIIESSGIVLLKRNGSSSYRRVSVGTEVFRGDVLQPAKGAKVTVRCANLRRWVVPAGIPSNLNSGCPETSKTIVGLRGGGLETIAGGTDPTIPYVISPRRTWLLTRTPLLKWNPVPGTSGYVVKVKGPGVNWQTRVTGTEVVYPGDPPLQPGETYLLMVEADNGRFSQSEPVNGAATARAISLYEDDQVMGWGFSLLPDADAKMTEAEVKRVKDWEFWELSADTKALAIADIYIDHDLYSEAIASLESVVQQGSKVPTVYRLLGDLYAHVGLNLLAEARYQTAIDQAKAAEDLEVQAKARVGLAQIYIVLSKNDSAIFQLKQAQADYRSLGDGQRADDLEATLAKLATRSQKPAQSRSQ